MNKKQREEIWKDGNSLLDYPIDIDMKGELQSNGSVENIVEFNGKYYYVQTSWQEEIGRVQEINKNDAPDCILELIKKFEESETK